MLDDTVHHRSPLRLFQGRGIHAQLLALNHCWQLEFLIVEANWYKWSTYKSRMLQDLVRFWEASSNPPLILAVQFPHRLNRPIRTWPVARVNAVSAAMVAMALADSSRPWMGWVKKIPCQGLGKEADGAIEISKSFKCCHVQAPWCLYGRSSSCFTTITQTQVWSLHF